MTIKHWYCNKYGDIIWPMHEHVLHIHHSQTKKCTARPCSLYTDCSSKYQANKTMFTVQCQTYLCPRPLTLICAPLVLFFVLGLLSPRSLPVSDHSLSSRVHQSALVQTSLPPTFCPPALDIISNNHSRFGSK